MNPRHVLSVTDLQDSDVAWIASRSLHFATTHSDHAQTLKGKMIGIYFRKSSTRTRMAFTIGAGKLGALPISIGPHDLQVNTGETIQDTGQVLSGFLDALVIRTAESLSEMQLLAGQTRMPIINAMSENEHPTQSLADMSALLEHRGSLENVHLLYMGEGNNTAAALALAFSRVRGACITFLTPEGYGLPSDTFLKACQLSKSYGAQIRESHESGDLPADVDVVYTTRWQTTGTIKFDPEWRNGFLPFRVTEPVMKAVSKATGTVFMHDLPAVRGDEVEAEVLDGPQSIAFRQADHKLFSAMALLEWCILGPTATSAIVAGHEQLNLADPAPNGRLAFRNR
jgi:ornithine carbamoyltransferase